MPFTNYNVPEKQIDYNNILAIEPCFEKRQNDLAKIKLAMDQLTERLEIDRNQRVSYKILQSLGNKNEIKANENDFKKIEENERCKSVQPTEWNSDNEELNIGWNLENRNQTYLSDEINIFEPEITITEIITNHNLNQQSQSEDDIILGPNGTTISSLNFQSITWESVSVATRKLLSTVFTVDILGTHSLTGKPSPAFIGRERPQKMQLDPNKIKDIVHMVMSKINTSEREVRASITTKCADASRNLKMKLKRKNAKNN